MNKRLWLLGVSLAIIATILFLLQEPAPIQRQGLGNAPELQGIAGYINTDNITISELVGKKIILIDFWTYTCINCQRTLPYLTMWYETYRDDGLVIIGVHTPEFEFEKKYDNVLSAAKKWNIQYPVVLDNDYQTWRAYANRYWPHKYLIDVDGNVVYDHVGEGGYAETEQRIQEELMKLMQRRGGSNGIEKPTTLPAEAVTVEFSRIRTPEIYFGYGFPRGNIPSYASATPEQPHTFTDPDPTDLNAVALTGTWTVGKDGAELVSDNGRVSLLYDAKVVNIVASGTSPITVHWDTKTPGDAHGASIDDNGNGQINDETLYELINAPGYGPHRIDIDATKGFTLYTFTFG
mgnify:CR=1 FL=1